MKNFILGFLAAILFAAIGYGAYYMGAKQGLITNLGPTPTTALVSPSSTPSVSDTSLVGADKDIHGCIGSAGYEWCAPKNKCLRPWEESCTGAQPSDIEAIKQALIQKNGWTNMNIDVTISKNDGTYASGGIKEKGSETGGGYFFAVKDNGTWKIVADGNGTISCASLVPYPNYPTSMIPECFDETTGNSVKR